MPADIQSSRQLIKRYGHAAATCSDYPPIGPLQQGVAAIDLLRALRSGQRPLHLAVSLLPMQSAFNERYLACLGREVELLGCHIGAKQSVQRLHLSRGAVSAEQLQRLLTLVRKRFAVHSSAFGDDSVEIDPAQTDWARMGLLRELGFNHVSIGVADACSPAAGVVVDFRDSRKTRWLIEAARTLQFTSVNIDLGYGRAWQSLNSFRNKLAAIIELQPGRILLFDYAYPPQRYRSSQRRSARDFAAAPDKQAMYQHALEKLDAAGYCYIGLGQFALKDDPLVGARESGGLQLNWLGYSCEASADLLGIGVGGISHIGTLQLQNRRDLASYQMQLANDQLATFHGRHSSAQEQLQSALSEALLCDLQVDLQALEASFGELSRDYMSACRPALEQMAADGLLQLTPQALSILPAGRLLVGAVCKVLEQGRTEPAATQRRFGTLSAMP
ncbi:MAG: coproporphyrinogen III oxidase [Pseudomonas sp.]|uniref:coproporphyrinogen III oxidase n=1 Tax=Pseudomonas sp. FEMGT703P TaxID=2080764 RepID=UPI000CB4974E|nr:coproporphyrinogen III oxidase [Pseudomonas sp. FEMGT703P]PJE40625.1 MAG: coproporphyrinogen III oxidase [Pseudomonas sp.] [Pseudomonas sp. FEMGT703P]